MQEQTTVYYSRVDVLVALAKRLNLYEERHQLSSEDFFDRFSKGQLDDTLDFVEWSNDYRHFLALKLELEDRLSHAA
ncbi:hypothetical protein KJ068_15735 [bacterium]|nr:hypothetical protein [bacterium]RIK56414.1 MAG: hypothetical protein DCC62_30455 [candidate division KSB1 bacterium]